MGGGGGGEVLRRIIGKTISAMFKEEIKEAVGPLQVCAGHSAGSEAAIHAMNQVFNEEGLGADGVLLIDATSAFNDIADDIAQKPLDMRTRITLVLPPFHFQNGGRQIKIHHVIVEAVTPLAFL